MAAGSGSGMIVPMPIPMPYPTYPPPVAATPWYPQPNQMQPGMFPGQLPFPGVHGMPPNLPTNAQSVPAIPTPSPVPKLAAWLEYCDQHVDRSGDNLVQYKDQFEAEGFRRLDQLFGNIVSVEDISRWLSIKKGVAVTILNYANDDMALVRAGKFTMPQATI